MKKVTYKISRVFKYVGSNPLYVSTRGKVLQNNNIFLRFLIPLSSIRNEESLSLADSFPEALIF
jgi:hypothetical protein